MKPVKGIRLGRGEKARGQIIIGTPKENFTGKMQLKQSTFSLLPFFFDFNYLYQIKKNVLGRRETASGQRFTGGLVEKTATWRVRMTK